MAQYRVSLTTAATAATADLVLVALWNPHASRRISLAEISLVAIAAPAASAGFAIRRMTARGTPATSVAATAAHGVELGAVTPPSGFVLEHGVYSVAPTFAAGRLDAWVLAAASGSGIRTPYSRPIEIGPGAGLAIVTRAAIIVPALEVAVAVDD